MTNTDIHDIQTLKELLRSAILNKFSQLDPELHKFLFEEAILTGGAIPSLWTHHPINDWDLYLSDEAAINSFKTYITADKHFQKQVKDINPKCMIDTEVEGKMITSNAVTMHNNVQVITMATKSFRDTFDYIHCMPWYDIKNDKLYISPQQLNAIKAKKLIINPKAKNPPTTYRRQKYIERGWHE